MKWLHHKYNAEYFWSVRKYGVEIEYIEGDVYITIAAICADKSCTKKTHKHSWLIPVTV